MDALSSSPSPLAARATAARWRDEADELDRQARLARQDGDPAYAEELESAALDYRIAADLLA